MSGIKNQNSKKPVSPVRAKFNSFNRKNKYAQSRNRSFSRESKSEWEKPVVSKKNSAFWFLSQKTHTDDSLPGEIIFSLVVFIFLTFFISNKTSFAQDTPNTISTAVPFLLIAPDARSGAMGDAGIALSADAHSIFWNTAKIALSAKRFDIGFNYAPWLTSLSDDIYLSSLAGFACLDNKQGITFGLRYFNLGSITFTNSGGGTIGEFKPREYCVEAGYTRKLTDHFATGIDLGYIYSNLASGFGINNVPIHAGKAVKADISFFYNHPMKFMGNKKSEYNLGATISNIGNKITYTDDAQNKEFLPANLGIAGGITFRFNEYNRLTFDLDLNKLLVPTPDTAVDYRNETVPESIFASFGDAPGGYREELNEITISSGAEYCYHDLLFCAPEFLWKTKQKEVVNISPQEWESAIKYLA